jgi:hypothetical protein
MLKRLLTLVALCAFVSAGSAAAQAPAVAGEWNASMNSPGGVREFKIVFEVSGDSLIGTVKRASGDVPLSGKLSGDKVTFRYVIVYNGNDFPMMVTALVNGDSMRGVVDFNGQLEEEFWASRAGVAAAGSP